MGILESEIKLKNGSLEPRMLVVATLMNLKSLFQSADLSGAVAVYELYQVCKNPSYQIFSVNALQTLQNASLLDGQGQVHGSIRNIVLSAIEELEGGVDIRIVNPAQPE